MISPTSRLAAVYDRPHFRCHACPDDHLYAGGYTTAEAHYARSHPGQAVDVELLTLGSGAHYTPSPNPEDMRKRQR